MQKIIKNLKYTNSGKSNLSCFCTNVSVEDKTSMMLSFDERNEKMIYMKVFYLMKTTNLSIQLKNTFQQFYQLEILLK